MLTRKKLSLLIGAVVIIVIVLIGVFCYWQQTKVVSTEQPLTEQEATPLIVNYDQPLNIDVQNIDWVKAQWPANGYHHDLDVWYPANWSFDCCGDTDSFSAHTIWPVNNQIEWTKDDKQPSITYFDQGLFGCPANDSQCSIDQVIPKTSKEIFTEQKSQLTNYDQLELANLNTIAVVYETSDDDLAVSKNYLINSGNGVSLIRFYRFKAFPADFISEFLQRLQIAK